MDAIMEGAVLVDDLMLRFGVTEGTMRNRLSRLCKKTKSKTMAELVWKIMRGRV